MPLAMIADQAVKRSLRQHDLEQRKRRIAPRLRFDQPIKPGGSSIPSDDRTRFSNAGKEIGRYCLRAGELLLQSA
jgi:hypothetical protein